MLRDKIPKMEMPYIEERICKYSKESPRVEPTRRKKKRKTQDDMAKHSENGSRTSREELAGNK
jgi:hypothetical protein